MAESVCYKCESCRMISKGFSATRWEPEEEPDFDCAENSFNFMTDDGCCHFAERDETDYDRSYSHSWYERNRISEMSAWVHGIGNK